MENIKLDNTSSMILVGKCGPGRYWFKSNPSLRLNVQRLGSLIGRVATEGNRNICWHGMCNWSVQL